MLPFSCAEALANEAMDAERSWTTGSGSGNNDRTSLASDSGNQKKDSEGDEDQNDKVYV
jgi:hypothetical protein